MAWVRVQTPISLGPAPFLVEKTIDNCPPPPKGKCGSASRSHTVVCLFIFSAFCTKKEVSFVFRREFEGSLSWTNRSEVVKSEN